MPGVVRKMSLQQVPLMLEQRQSDLREMLPSKRLVKISLQTSTRTTWTLTWTIFHNLFLGALNLIRNFLTQLLVQKTHAGIVTNSTLRPKLLNVISLERASASNSVLVLSRKQVWSLANYLVRILKSVETSSSRLEELSTLANGSAVKSAQARTKSAQSLKKWSRLA